MAVSLSAPSPAQDARSSARSFLDEVRERVGAEASLPKCEGQFEQTCRVELGRSFILRTEATTAGELLAVKLAHNEIAAEPPEQAAAYVAAVCEVLAGDKIGQVTELLNQAVESTDAVEKVVDGVLYRADAGSEILLEVRPAL